MKRSNLRIKNNSKTTIDKAEGYNSSSPNLDLQTKPYRGEEFCEMLYPDYSIKNKTVA
jgi:hypothetical protein